jgi:DNA-binding NarL/FixJ family response regulator
MMPKWQRTFIARKKQSDQTLDNKIRILIVDDHPIVRRGLAELVNHEDDFAVCGQAEDYHEALRAIGELNPNMAVVDISLKETSGLELIKDIHSQHPDLPVLALSMHDETLYAERALRAGAMGYIMKQSSPAHRSRLEPLSRQPRYFRSFFLICPALLRGD